MIRRCALLVALALAGCPAPTPPAQVRPVIRVGFDPCDECLMTVSEARFAAAYVTQGGETRRFDDIGDMLRYRAAHPEAVARFWVQDFQGGGWLPAAEAHFVQCAALRTPMSSGLVALSTSAAAAALASEKQGRVLGFDALLLLPAAQIGVVDSAARSARPAAE